MHVVHLLERTMPPPEPGDAGGMPVLVTWLARAQRNAGDRVTVVSPSGRATEAYEQRTPSRWTAEEIRAALPSDTDVVHLHGEGATLPGIDAACTDLPRVSTVHGNHEGRELPLTNRVYVSADHARRHGGRVFVYNGLPIADYAVDVHQARDGLIFLGKLRRSKKGAKAALRIARTCGEHLYLAGRPTWKVPASRLPAWPGITALGPVDGSDKLAALSRARALLFPIGWEEPFGLVLIEAMACGTPVIASRRGAVPEIVADGRTGMICDTEPEMVQATERLDRFDPEACQAHVREHFDIERTRREYSDLYRRAVSGERW